MSLSQWWTKDFSQKSCQYFDGHQTCIFGDLLSKWLNLGSGIKKSAKSVAGGGEHWYWLESRFGMLQMLVCITFGVAR